MKTDYVYRFALSLVILLFFISGVQAEPVGRIAPAVYEEILQAELTPLEPLLSQVDYFTPEESDHGCVLQETIVYIDDEGITYELYHYAYKALSNGDLDDLGSDLFTYRPADDNIYLILAETILPDGTVCPIPDEGVMVQAHQQDQDSMIFSGREQMRLVYPQVSKGSVTHFIVLIEREKTRLPNQYTARFSWERSWQTHIKRVVLDLPESYAQRLNMVALGDGVPEPQKSVSENGRTRYTWMRRKLPVRKWEYLGGPVEQTGPILFLSTLKDWDELAAWYAERLRESSEVTDAVRQVAVEWAGDARTEDEIIHNLAFKVANEIRYVSLEFGVGGLQPQPVGNVLANRFGDCKDKANFLRVLLQEHGIPSRLVLLNTEHGGFVEKRCADYKDFNHAILLIEKENGEEIFCDSTVKYGSAGLLYPSIADRPALVIDHTSGRSRWVQTPQAGAGDLNYDMDLKLTPNGELSGWFSLAASGYYASAFSRRFEATDRDSLIYEVERYIGSFYNDSSVIDYEIERSSPDQQAFTLRAYFIRPATGQAGLSVSWPTVKGLLPDPGEKKDVQRTAFLWNDMTHFTMKLELPEAMTVARLPEDWSVKCQGFSSDGRWTWQDGILMAEWNADVTRSHFPPAEFPQLFNAVDATSHWLEEPVILGEGAAGAPATAGAAESAGLGEEFVMMSTGQGQVDLIDHLYSADAKAAERRLALVKTKSWFPKDLATQFECDVRLGWLDYFAKRYEESLKTAREACRNYGQAVDASSMGWAQYLEARSLEELGMVEESGALYLSLENDEEQNGYRRGFAAYQYALMMSDRDPDLACKFFLKALAHDTQNEKWILENCYVFLLQHMEPDELAGELTKMYAVEPERAKAYASWLCALGVDRAPQLLGLVEAAEISRVLASLEFAEEAAGPEKLAQLTQLAAMCNAYQEGRSALKTHLEQHSYAFWDAEPDKDRGFDDYTEDIGQAIEDNDIEHSARMALWRMLYLEPEVEFPEWVWDASRMIDYLYKHDQRELEPLLSFLFDMQQYLPEDEEGAIDLLFLQAESLAREGFNNEALAIYQRLHEQELADQWWDSLYTRWAALLVASQQSDKALEIYELARHRLRDNEDFLPLCIQGAYALFERGRSEEALEWIHEMYEVANLLGWDNDLVSHLSQWVELEDAGLLEAFLQHQEQWWPAWKLAQEAAGLPEVTGSHSVIFSGLEDAGVELGNAMLEKDLPAVSAILESMIIGAKWHPALCLEVQSLTSFLAEEFPAAETEFLQFAVANNSEAYQLNPTNRYSCRINGLEALLQLKQYDELMEQAETYRNDTLLPDEGILYCRYGALGAINLGEAGTHWLSCMESQLQNADYANDPYVVNIVGLLYRLENRPKDEEEVLRNFLAGYEGDNQQMLTLLKSRHEQVLTQLDGNVRLTEALNDWIALYGPSWLACFPDPMIGQEEISEVSRDVKELLQQDDVEQLEDAAYLWYAALDERLDSTTREEALLEFLSASLLPLWDSRSNLDMLSAIVKDDRFSSAMRNHCAGFALNIALSVHMAGYLEDELLPLLEGLDLQEEINAGKDNMVEICNLDGFSPEALTAWMDGVRTSGTPVDGRTAFLLGSCFHDLCRIGAVEEAREQIAGARNLRFDSSSGLSSLSLQLEWQQKLDLVEEMLPLHEVMQTFFMDKLNPATERPTYAEMMFSNESGFEKRRALNRTALEYGLYEHLSLGFWADLNDTEYLNGNISVDAENLASVMDSLLAVCESDQQYSMAIYLITQLFDTDDPACKAIFSEKTSDLFRRPELRDTHQHLLWYRYHDRIRSGDHARSLTDLRSEEGLPKDQLHALIMTALLASGDREALDDYLDTASPDLLLTDSQIGNTMLAFKLCGRDSGFELLQERGIEVLNEFKAQTLQSGEWISMHYTIQMADILGKQDLLTDAWVAQAGEIAMQEDLINLKMKLGNLREDWPATETHSRALVKCAPFHYDNYFFLGKALIKQGKFGEGLEFMDVFIRYCRDDLNYQESLQLAAEAREQR